MWRVYLSKNIILERSLTAQWLLFPFSPPRQDAWKVSSNETVCPREITLTVISAHAKDEVVRRCYRVTQKEEVTLVNKMTDFDTGDSQRWFLLTMTTIVQSLVKIIFQQWFVKAVQSIEASDSKTLICVVLCSYRQCILSFKDELHIKLLLTIKLSARLIPEVSEKTYYLLIWLKRPFKMEPDSVRLTRR